MMLYMIWPLPNIIIFSFLSLYFIEACLGMVFWMEIIFPQIFKDVLSLSSFHLIFMKSDVILIPNPAHKICFFSLEAFRIFALFLVFGNFMCAHTHKYKCPFASYLLCWRINGTFQSGNTWLIFIYLITFPFIFSVLSF